MNLTVTLTADEDDPPSPDVRTVVGSPVSDWPRLAAGGAVIGLSSSSNFIGVGNILNAFDIP